MGFKSRYDINVGDIVFFNVVNLFGPRKVIGEVTFINKYIPTIRCDCEDGVQRVIRLEDVLEVA